MAGARLVGMGGSVKRLAWKLENTCDENLIWLTTRNTPNPEMIKGGGGSIDT